MKESRTFFEAIMKASDHRNISKTQAGLFADISRDGKIDAEDIHRLGHSREVKKQLGREK